MPKIGKRLYNIDTPDLKEYGLYYDSKKGFYIKGLPNDFETITNIAPYFETESLLDNDIYFAIKKYREVKSSSRIVIAYNVKAALQSCMNQVSANEYSGYKKGINSNVVKKLNGILHQNINQNSFGFVINYEIFEEVSDGVTMKYFSLDKNTLKRRNGIVHELNNEGEIIDYSIERIRFFEQMRFNMESMLMKISDFFSQDKEVLLKIMESTDGQRLI